MRMEEGTVENMGVSTGTRSSFLVRPTRPLGLVVLWIQHWQSRLDTVSADTANGVHGRSIIFRLEIGGSCEKSRIGRTQVIEVMQVVLASSWEDDTSQEAAYSRNKDLETDTWLKRSFLLRFFHSSLKLTISACNHRVAMPTVVKGPQTDPVVLS